MKKIKWAALALSGAVVLGSCGKKDNENAGGAPSKAASGAVKAALPSGMLFGMAAGYNLMTSNSDYASVVTSEANSVTFENELKYASVVKNDGSFDYTTADAFYTLCANAGLDVFGHTLVWYQQQNTTYLNGITGGSGSGNAVNLATNGSFETWSNPSAAPDGWGYYNGSTYLSQGTGSQNVQAGSNSIQISGYGAGAGSGWHVQFGQAISTTTGNQIKVSFYAKASDASNCYYQGEGNNGGDNVYYTGDIQLNAAWQQYTYTFTASSNNPKITLDMARNAVGTTVWVDNIVVEDLTAEAANSTPTAVAGRVDSVVHLWINSTVSHYAGKIKAWDVVNELFADDGTIRVNATGDGVFVWAKYLGKDLGVKAFNYAHAADPTALLFINDYGLETNTQKLDSLIAYVQWLKGQGVQVDGIGTQMHIGINTPKTSVDYMFKKLAATGLKIRISELDVSANPTTLRGFVLSPAVLGYQRTTYQEVVSSYMQNVPAAQRYGITVWGVDDPHSWKYKNGTDYPLLFDGEFKKKAAYDGFLQGLRQ
ncbi:MAG TPA: endo-1,4-beta-xylanase [Puia sp.]|nr:endo-1,4-beta-xylanase [Puia sp.]